MLPLTEGGLDVACVLLSPGCTKTVLWSAEDEDGSLVKEKESEDGGIMQGRNACARGGSG